MHLVCFSYKMITYDSTHEFGGLTASLIALLTLRRRFYCSPSSHHPMFESNFYLSSNNELSVLYIALFSHFIVRKVGKISKGERNEKRGRLLAWKYDVFQCNVLSFSQSGRILSVGRVLVSYDDERYGT